MKNRQDLNESKLRKDYSTALWSLVSIGICSIFAIWLFGTMNVKSKLWETRPYMKYVISIVILLGILIPTLIRTIKLRKKLNNLDSTN